MAYELTWQFDINRVPDLSTALTLGAYQAWWLKAFLLGQIGGPAPTQGLWSIIGSSDGVTAGCDGVDRWTSTYTFSKFVNSNSSNPRSWIILGSPVAAGTIGAAARCYIGFEFSNFNFNNPRYWHGSGLTPTGGTTSSFPSLGSQSFYVEGSVNQWNAGDGASVGYHLHGLLSSRGDFILKSSRDGDAKYYWSWSLFLAQQNPHAGDLWPWAMNIHSQSDTNSVRGPWSRLASQRSLAINSTASGGWISRDKTNSNFQFPRPIYFSKSDSAASPATEDLPAGGDAVDGKFVGMPQWLYNQAAKTIKGRLPDVLWAPTALRVGSVDSTSAPTYTVVGDSWQPTNQSPIL